LLFAFDRTNVPLKNWGGFSLNRSWVYDALEKIVLAGLAEEVHLNTKPLSRMEASGIVAQAVRRLRWDQYGDYNHRGYLEETLYRLVKEFGHELAEMGVKTPLNENTPPVFFGFQPISNIQFGLDLTTSSRSLVSNFGRRLDKGVNRTSSFDGRMHVGDFFSLYYQPEFSWGETKQGRLQSGYAKLTLWNVELEAGRDSLWWGPGFRGSMTISNNARPLDLVRLSSAEPFRLPWLLGYLGSWKLVTFLAQLEKDRDVPDAKLSGTRISLAPSRFVEVGFSRLFQFGGRGRRISPGQFLSILAFDQGSDDPNSPEQVNNVMSFDATLRIPDVQRYILIARDMTLYGDFGWDDTLFGVIVPERPGGIVGTYLTGLFGDPKLDLRIEYSKTSDIQFNHFLYTSGFTFRGSVLSHFIGTRGNELYARLTRWISPDLFLGLQLSQAEIGPPGNGLLGSPREKRSSFGLDLSYRISDHSSIFLGYDFARVKDRGFVAGRSGSDNLFRIEFNRSFGQ
ncbi:MAG: capsule assembly Wzi family protein, partial [Candidatus Binatia bacterium]